MNYLIILASLILPNLYHWEKMQHMLFQGLDLLDLPYPVKIMDYQFVTHFLQHLLEQ